VTIDPNRHDDCHLQPSSVVHIMAGSAMKPIEFDDSS